MKRMYECGICECYHPWEWSGDCRDDENRFGDPEVYAQKLGIDQDEIEVLSMQDRLDADCGKLKLFGQENRMNYSPTPWKPVPLKDWGSAGTSTQLVKDSSGCTCAVLEAKNAEANAAFIVRACNAHEELLEAGILLRALLCDGYGDIENREESLNQALEAIAKAEGKE